MMTIEDAKAALPLSALWLRLGLPGQPPERDGQNVSCPFPANHANGDKNPSFNFYRGRNGRRFKCFACGIDGGSVDLLALALGLDDKAACRKLIELAEGAPVPVARPVSSVRAVAVSPSGAESLATVRPALLAGLHEGNRLAHTRLMQSRSLRAGTVDLGLLYGVLRFGEVCGFASWVILDGSRRAVEARRLDRLAFPPLGRLGERKAHSLKGTDKSWPVGAENLRAMPADVRVMLVEGGPDFLAALHFLDEWETLDVWPVAMLGRSTGGTIYAEVLALLKGRKVRIYPHADADGGGWKAGEKWAAQLAGAGCDVDRFCFDGLRQRDGSPVKDLNDCCLIHADDAAKLGGLLP